MKRLILITGGFGYIGGRVAQALVKRPDLEIKLGTRRMLQSPTWLPGVSSAQIDWQSQQSLLDALTGVDTVLHLAAMHEGDCSEHPVEALLVNGGGTARLLEAAQTRNVRQIIYLSTIHVYGSPLVGVISEKTLPMPRSSYAISHRVAEDYILGAHASQTLNGIVLRLSNGFGAPAHPGISRWTLLVNDLCRQAVETRSMTLRSAGLQSRNFIAIHDVARAISHCLDIDRTTMGDGLYNLGGDISVRVIDMVSEIADRCESVLGYRPPIRCAEPGPAEVTLPLEYRIDKFRSTGFALAGNRIEEIDATLRFCQGAFCR